MKKINIISFIMLVSCVFILSSCEDEDRTYQGPVYYEFSPDKTGQTVSGSSNLITKETSVSGADQITIQMIKKNDKPTKINFKFVAELYLIKSSSKYVTEKPTDLDPSEYVIYPTTTQYGVDFEIPATPDVEFNASSGTGSVTIAAGEMFGTIPLDIKERDNNTLYIVLEDSENAKANKPTSLLALSINAVKTVYFEESFKNGIPSTWGNIDKDGDGYIWTYTSTDGGFAMSRSYLSSVGALTPENYLISPAITIPAGAQDITLSYGISASAKNAYQEQYRIIISEDPITDANCRNATILQDWKVLTADHKYWTVVTTTASLQAYAGKTVYIGFLHGNTVDMDRLLLKDVVVYGY